MSRCLECARLERENRLFRRLITELLEIERVRWKQSHGDWNAEPPSAAELASLGMFTVDDREAA